MHKCIWRYFVIVLVLGFSLKSLLMCHIIFFLLSTSCLGLFSRFFPLCPPLILEFTGPRVLKSTIFLYSVLVRLFHPASLVSVPPVLVCSVCSWFVPCGFTVCPLFLYYRLVWLDSPRFSSSCQLYRWLPFCFLHFGFLFGPQLSLLKSAFCFFSACLPLRLGPLIDEMWRINSQHKTGNQQN